MIMLITEEMFLMNPKEGESSEFTAFSVVFRRNLSEYQAKFSQAIYLPLSWIGCNVR